MKFYALFLLSVLMIGLVSAAYGANVAVSADAQVEKKNQSGDNASKDSYGIGSELSLQIAVKKAALKEGNYTGSLGQLLNVRQLSANLREIRSNNVSAKTSLNITVEGKDNNAKFKVNLSNGQESEIKVMPDRASQTAIAKLQINACSADNNCMIELKEVGSKNDVKVAYNVKAEKQVKVLGLFRAKMNVEVNVDAETGETISSSVPWWASISTDL